MNDYGFSNQIKEFETSFLIHIAGGQSYFKIPWSLNGVVIAVIFYIQVDIPNR